jgi:hypothetical protein
MLSENSEMDKERSTGSWPSTLNQAFQALLCSPRRCLDAASTDLIQPFIWDSNESRYDFFCSNH